MGYSEEMVDDLYDFPYSVTCSEPDVIPAFVILGAALGAALAVVAVGIMMLRRLTEEK